MIVGLCAGHSVKSWGATYGEVRERDVCREIVDFATPLLEACGHEVFDPRSDELPLSYPDYLLHRIAALSEQHVDVAIDVHLNASIKPEANYSVVLYGSGQGQSVPFAQAVAGAFDVLPWRTCSAMPDAEMGRRLAFCRRLTCPSIIVEPLFLSSPEAREWLFEEKGRERLGVQLVEGIQGWVDNAPAGAAEVVDERV